MSRRRNNAATAVAYVRVSTEDQKLGPEAQRAAIEAWAAREGVEVVAWHVDQGVSGAAPLEACTGLVAALAGIREHGAGILAVAKRDRLGREVHKVSGIDLLAKKAGARIVSADGTANGDSPADALMRTILDGMSEYERALIRARTKAALAVKKAKGEKLGGLAPYGFAVAADGRTLEPNAAEQSVIATIRSLAAEGMSRRAIVAELAARGVVGRTGNPMQVTQIGRILTGEERLAA